MLFRSIQLNKYVRSPYRRNPLNTLCHGGIIIDKTQINSLDLNIYKIASFLQTTGLCRRPLLRVFHVQPKRIKDVQMLRPKGVRLLLSYYYLLFLLILIILVLIRLINITFMIMDIKQNSCMHACSRLCSQGGHFAYIIQPIDFSCI